MKIDIYGHFQLDVVRENGAWAAYRQEQGKRARLNELVFPEDLKPDEVPVYLDDIYHEMARPGQTVSIISVD